MLGKSAHEDLEVIKTAMANFWGDNCIIENINIINLIMFDLKLKLYNFANIKIEYDRGTLSFSLKKDDKYIFLSKLTDKNVYKGFEVMKPEIMHHNFSVLDEVAKKHIAEQTL